MPYFVDLLKIEKPLNSIQSLTAVNRKVATKLAF